jgi:DNA-binding response OmpR family regulator
MLDVNLQGEMSFPAAEALARRRIPFLFATAYGDGARIPDSLADRMVLTKPFGMQELGAALRTMLSAGPPLLAVSRPIRT